MQIDNHTNKTAEILRDFTIGNNLTLNNILTPRIKNRKGKIYDEIPNQTFKNL